MKKTAKEKKTADSIQSIFKEKPKICCIDLKNDDIKALLEYGFNITEGTLGSKINVPNHSAYKTHNLLLNFNLPINLHEFDIIIIDLGNFETVEYNEEEHTRTKHVGKSATALKCSFPETLFDPRPFGSTILNQRLSDKGNRFQLIIAFTSN